MNEGNVKWERDGLDAGWFVANRVGSIRNSASYRPGGWWFLPAWLPDQVDHDVGPFKTKASTIERAEELARQHYGSRIPA